MRYLNLTAVLISFVFVSLVRAEESKELFNGKDLAGWEGDNKFWSVEDGAITGRTTKDNPAKHNTFLVWKGGTLKDFELHVMFKIANHNSGVQYRSKDLGDHVVAGYQADMVGDVPDRYTGILYEEKGRGILAERGQSVVIGEHDRTKDKIGDPDEIAKAIKRGDWNEYTIIARGNHLTQKINGVTTVEVTDNDAKHAAQEGVLALQIHMGPPMTVQFKDIQLKVLTDAPKPKAD